MRFCPPARSHRRRRARAKRGQQTTFAGTAALTAASGRVALLHALKSPSSRPLQGPVGFLPLSSACRSTVPETFPPWERSSEPRSSAPATRPRAARRGARSSSAHPVPYPLPASGPADAAARSSRPATSREHGIMRVWTAPGESTQGQGLPPVRATLLGPFSVSRGELRAGPWQRPSARRLLQLVLVSPGRQRGRPGSGLRGAVPPLGRPRRRRSLDQGPVHGQGGAFPWATTPLGCSGPTGPGSGPATWSSTSSPTPKRCARPWTMPRGLSATSCFGRPSRRRGCPARRRALHGLGDRAREALALLRQEACLALARDRPVGLAAPALKRWPGPGRRAWLTTRRARRPPQPW